MSIKCQQRCLFVPIIFVYLPATLFFSSQNICGQEDDSKHLATLRKIRVAIDAGQQDKGLQLVDQLIRDAPNNAIAYYIRGREKFKANKVKQSVADFDKYVELKPSQSASQWERGISLYYAGKFKAGAKQFEEYQTYHDSDVENSVWRFLCVAKTEGIEAARKNMLEISGDTRVPMMKIYAMYRGECEPADVIAEAKKGAPNEAELNHRMFYVSLYIGLLESLEKESQESAEKHLRAAVKHKIGHYMWNVADVHVKREFDPDVESAE